MNIIDLQEVSHTFKLGNISVPVLFDINLAIRQGEVVSLCGSSGSGKSTLLNLVAGLMPVTQGKIIVNNIEINKLNENQLCLFRQKNIGFIFQSFNLLPNLTALDNVELPLVFSGVEPRARREKAMAILERLGLGDRIGHKPNELSGGQQQRVSIARALVADPPIILADEPTGNLDSVTGDDILNLMLRINQDQNITFLIVTHNLEQARYSNRVIHLKDGRIVDEEEVQGI
jgi:putative ABC transport system ATP-binding protein